MAGQGLSTEEIRARVQRADEQRITTRAEAASRVHVLAGRRDELAAQLALLEQDLVDAVGQAGRVMTAEELVQFSGRTLREVRVWTGEGRPARRAGGNGSGGGRRAGRSTRTAAAAGSAENGDAGNGKAAAANEGAEVRAGSDASEAASSAGSRVSAAS